MGAAVLGSSAATAGSSAGRFSRSAIGSMVAGAAGIW
jgi:hypothetical protein